MPDNNTCHNCKFYDTIFTQEMTPTNQGKCTRFPPTLLVVNTPAGQQGSTQFPIVKPTWSCGEWKKKIFEARTIEDGMRQ